MCAPNSLLLCVWAAELIRLTPSVCAVFTNILRESLLQDLAEADDQELVKQVQVRVPLVSCVCFELLLTPDCNQEYFADYVAPDSMLFTLELQDNLHCYMPHTWESAVRGP